MSSLYARLRRQYDPDCVTRRDALAVFAGVAGSLLVDPALGREKAPREVIVIGAGFAGLSAAYQLTQLGYVVRVYEARHRYGGRVTTFTDLVPGKITEGGGEMTGPNQPTWKAYREKFGLVPYDVVNRDDQVFPIYLDGELLDPKTARKVYDGMDVAMKSMLDDAATVDPAAPWKAKKAKAWDVLSQARWIAGLKVDALTRKALTVEFAGINGVEPSWQSYLGNLAMIQGGGGKDYFEHTDTQRIKGGNNQLARLLAGQVEKSGKGKVFLNTPVVAVTCEGHKVEVTTTKDGKRQKSDRADDVILAVPPSVWAKIDFEPALPATLRPQMARGTKFLAGVDSRYWQKKKLEARAWSDGPVNRMWESTNNQPGERGACLTLLSGGDAADEVRAWRPKERERNFLREADRLFPGVQGHFTRGRYLDWVADPWARGTYSFPAPGEILAQGPTLTDGIGRLHFAGEHVCYAFVGYMEGGLNSGVAVAKRLARRDGLLKG